MHVTIHASGVATYMISSPTGSFSDLKHEYLGRTEKHRGKGILTTTITTATDISPLLAEMSHLSTEDLARTLLERLKADNTIHAAIACNLQAAQSSTGIEGDYSC